MFGVILLLHILAATIWTGGQLKSGGMLYRIGCIIEHGFIIWVWRYANSKE